MVWQQIKDWFGNRHILDNPATDLTDESIFGSGYAAATGESVSLLKALGLPSFRQAVTIISGDIAKFPFEPHKLNPDGTTEVDHDDPLYRVTAWMPNPEMDAFTFWRRMMIHALIYTHSYAVIRRNPATGVVTELLPLLSDRTHSELRGGRLLFVSEINGRLEVFFPSEIFHLKGMCAGAEDCELLKDTRNTIALGLASQGFASRFFRRGGRIGGILQLPPGMPKPTRDTVETGFTRAYDDPDAQFRTIILRDDVKFHAGQFDPESAQLVEARDFDVKEIARIFNLIPSKLGDSSRTAYNTLEAEEKFYITSSLAHWLCALRGEARTKLLTPAQREGRTHDVIHDVEVFIDAVTRANVGKTEIEMGVRSRNEYRVKTLKIPPVDGLDEMVGPLNMGPVQTDRQSVVTDKLNMAMRAPFSEAIERGMRRALVTIKKESKRKKPSSFCNWLDTIAPEELFDDMAEELHASSGPVAILLRTTPQTLVKDVCDAFIEPLIADVNKCLDVVKPDDLAQEVRTISDRHAKRHADLLSILEVENGNPDNRTKRLVEAGV